jgi:hypothetical protein
MVWMEMSFLDIPSLHRVIIFTLSIVVANFFTIVQKLYLFPREKDFEVLLTS